MNTIEQFLIGGCSAICSRTATAPLELLKIQKQNSYMNCVSLRDTIRNDGFFGLWKGNGLNCLRVFPQQSISYGIYSLHISSYPFINGCLGGLISTFCIYPLETLRTRFSLQSKKDYVYKGLIDSFRKTDTRTLYQGFGITSLGYMSFTGLNFMFYETYKYYTENSFLSGGLSGITSLCFTYPTDLIRRRFQLQGFHTRVPNYSSIYDCIKKVYTLNGIGGFYRGFGINIIKIFPSMSIQFYLIDTFQNRLNTLKTYF